MQRRDFQGFLSVGGFMNLISMLAYVAGNNGAQAGLIFNQENGSGAGNYAGWRRNLFACGLFHRARHVERERSSLAGRAFHSDVAAALLDDAVDGGKSKACAFSRLLGGEEWLKDMAQRLRIHAPAIVGKR